MLGVEYSPACYKAEQKTTAEGEMFSVPQHELFGHRRFMAQIRVGAMPHDKVMRAIELFGTEVAPAVRKELAIRLIPG